ncbi:MAG: PilZ domain-containing protein [Desulfobulbaceae bacterium]|nr:PilZ domain-containing protein [Desulfobulbaceae bacterium]
MLYYITLLIIFIVLVCAIIILFRKFAYIQKQSKEQQKRESEFLINLVAKGELKPDQLPQLSNLVENNAIDEVFSQLEKTESPLDSILELIDSLSDEEMRQLFEELEKRQTGERRKYHRKDLFRIMDYNVGGQDYRDLIQDISGSGVFIKTVHTFSAGQSILMTLMSPTSQKPFKIIGEIIRVHTDGIGVKFKIESQVQEEVLNSLVDLIKN